MREEKWIPVETESLHTNESVRVRGVEINVGLSPYEVPEGISGHYDKSIGRFVIRMKYLQDDEERISAPTEDHITLVVGKHSGCLYEIHVDVDEIGAKSVALKLCLPRVNNEIRKLAKNHRFSKKRRHYDVVKEALGKAEEELLAVD